MGSFLPGWWPVSRFITGRQASPAGDARYYYYYYYFYLVTYQNSGVGSYCVRFSNACGVVDEMFVFQT